MQVSVSQNKVVEIRGDENARMRGHDKIIHDDTESWGCDRSSREFVGQEVGR